MVQEQQISEPSHRGPELVIPLGNWTWRVAELVGESTSHFFDEIDPSGTSNPSLSLGDSSAKSSLVPGHVYFNGSVEVTGNYEDRTRTVSITDTDALIRQIDAIRHWGSISTPDKVELLKEKLILAISATESGELYDIKHPNPTARIHIESHRRSPNNPDAFRHLLNSIDTTPTPERFVRTVSLIDFHEIGQFKAKDEHSPPGIPPEDE